MPVGGSRRTSDSPLPIPVHAVLFSAGDGHRLQGDGEVSGTAIERGANDHPVLCRQGAAGLEFRHLFDLDEAHAAGTDGRPEPGLIAEDGNLDSGRSGGLDHPGALGNLHLPLVDRDGDEVDRSRRCQARPLWRVCGTSDTLVWRRVVARGELSVPGDVSVRTRFARCLWRVCGTSDSLVWRRDLAAWGAAAVDIPGIAAVTSEPRRPGNGCASGSAPGRLPVTSRRRKGRRPRRCGPGTRRGTSPRRTR